MKDALNVAKIPEYLSENLNIPSRKSARSRSDS